MHLIAYGLLFLVYPQIFAVELYIFTKRTKRHERILYYFVPFVYFVVSKCFYCLNRDLMGYGIAGIGKNYIILSSR